MQLNELGAFLDGRFSYPVDEATVREHIGSQTIDSADTGEGLSIEAILENHRGDEFASDTELLQTILGELPDEYVGRKFYDDRGSNPEQVRDGPRAQQDESL